MTERTTPALTGALLGAAVIAIVAIPQWSSEPVVTAKKTDEQIEALQAETKRLANVARDLEARVILLEDGRSETADRVEEQHPRDARWIPLKPGGADQWDFPVGGRAQIQFLHVGDDGTPTFRVKHRAAEGDVALRAGEAMRAVDDLGSEQRVYTTTVHRVRLDRTGRPEAALLSVVVTRE